jgi:signal peptidase II
MGKKDRNAANPAPAAKKSAAAPAAPAPPVWRERVLFLAVALAGAVVDIVTKYWAFSALGARPVEQEGRILLAAEREILLLGETLKLQAAMNQGAVFGIFQGKWLFLAFFGVVAVGILGWVVVRSKNWGAPVIVGLGLVCSGAIGNLWDRCLFSGVRDFVAFRSSLLEPFLSGGRWPNFNFADAWICIGVPLILLGDYWNSRRAKAAEKGEISP